MNAAQNDRDYLDFFGLVEAPFALTPDPAFFFSTEDNQAAFTGICTCINRGEGYAVLTGDIGTGKSTLCRMLLSHLEESAETAFIVNPFLNEAELLRAILLDLGIQQEQDAPTAGKPGTQELVNDINDFLVQAHRKHRRCVAIIDEAHNLPISTLEQLRILGNLETNKEKLLQIVLVGQRELLDLLNSPRLGQLHQRIANWYHLEPLSAQQEIPYFSFRLERAGLHRPIRLSPGAAARAHKLTRGFPRLMNILFDRALCEARSQQKWEVSEKDVRQASKGVPLEHGIPGSGRPPSEGKRRRRAPVALLLILAAALGALGGLWAAGLFRPPPQEPPSQTAPLPVRRWAISLGTFNTMADAQQAVRDACAALQAVPGAASQQGYVVTLLGKERQERYQANVGEFKENEGALVACGTLRERGLSCNVVEGKALEIPSEAK